MAYLTSSKANNPKETLMCPAVGFHQGLLMRFAESQQSN